MVTADGAWSGTRGRQRASLEIEGRGNDEGEFGLETEMKARGHEQELDLVRRLDQLGLERGDDIAADRQ